MCEGINMWTLTCNHIECLYKSIRKLVLLLFGFQVFVP